MKKTSDSEQERRRLLRALHGIPDEVEVVKRGGAALMRSPQLSDHSEVEEIDSWSPCVAVRLKQRAGNGGEKHRSLCHSFVS